MQYYNCKLVETLEEKMLKFFYNGIKENGGKLQKCSYSISQLLNYPEGTYTIYARDYARFSKEVQQAFDVENNTDSMTDYFETDTIRVKPDHPLYEQVKAAHIAQGEHAEKVRNNRQARKFGKAIANLANG